MHGRNVVCDAGTQRMPNVKIGAPFIGIRIYKEPAPICCATRVFIGAQVDGMAPSVGSDCGEPARQPAHIL